MDLRKFTLNEKKIIPEIILNNNEVKITKIGDEIEFILKKKSAIQKYSKFLFFSPTTSIICDNEKDALNFFKKSISEGVEGLMFKNLNSEYLPGLRVGSMAKLKETKEDIDVVILGAEHGKGRRAGYYSSFLIGVRDYNPILNETNYYEIGKVSSGIKEDNESDISLKNISDLLEQFKIEEKDGFTIFEPRVIIQVRYQDIQYSNTYNSGYALRFPRIIALRTDKTLEEINSIDDIKKFKNFSNNN